MMTPFTTISGRPVPKVAFGTMQFGGTADEAQSRAMFEACRSAGIVHFDTAHAYTEGLSETMLGVFAAADREDLFIATKCGYPGGASPAAIMSDFDESRRRLDMDVVDLFYMHRFDPNTPLERTFETLARLQKEGSIRHIGVSNYAAWQVMKAQCVAARLDCRIDVIQPMYSLVKRQAEVELLPMCESEGIFAQCYSPLGGGLLTGKYAKGGGGRLVEDERYGQRYAVPSMHEAATQLAEIAQELRVHPATLAVAWVAHRSDSVGPIISARSEAQLAPSLYALNFPMDDALYARLGALTPTPPPATDRLEEA